MVVALQRMRPESCIDSYYKLPISNDKFLAVKATKQLIFINVESNQTDRDQCVFGKC